MKTEPDWRGMMSKMKVVSLGYAVRVGVPSLLISSIPAATRGLSFHIGRWGYIAGGSLVAFSVFAGWLLYPLWGVLGYFLFFWLLGTSGLVLAYGALRPTAYVKPICTRCRLLPVIKEHEAYHLAGVAGEKEVWTAMKSRHSIESLSLEGDPSICSFCPIPKRLKEA